MVFCLPLWDYAMRGGPEKKNTPNNRGGGFQKF